MNNPTTRNPNQTSAALCRIFSSNKSVPANRKKGFFTSHLPKKEGIGGILYLVAQTFKLFAKIQDQN
jgi:hypothetical protein